MVGSSFPSELLIWSFHYWFVEAYPTVCDPMDCSTPGFPVLHYLPEFAQHMSIELVMPSNHLVLCGPLLLLQSFPASGSFPMCQLFTSGGQTIEASALVLPMNVQGLFPLGLTGLIYLSDCFAQALYSALPYHEPAIPEPILC